MNKHKVLALIVSISLLLSLVITACAAPSQSPSPTPSQSPSPTPAPAPTATDTVYKWRANFNEARGGELWDNFHNFFLNPIMKMSGGQIEIECFSWGDLVAGDEILEAVGQEVIELSTACTAYHPDMIGYTTQFGMPGGLANNDDWQTFYLNYGFGEYIQDKVYTPLGVKLLGPQVEPGMVQALREPITSFADIKGLNLRSTGSNAKLFSALGASIADVPAAECYTALATGVIDGGTVGGSNCAWDESLHEVTSLWIVEPTAPASINLPIVMNLELWESLPDNLKEIILQARIAHSCRYWQAIKYNEGEILNNAKSKGVTIYKPTQEDIAMWNTAAENVWTELYESQVDAEPAGMLRDFMVRMGYYEE